MLGRVGFFPHREARHDVRHARLRYLRAERLPSSHSPPVQDASLIATTPAEPLPAVACLPQSATTMREVASRREATPPVGATPRREMALESGSTARLASLVMETINGCTVIESSEAAEPISFGQAETNGAYRILAGTIPAGHPAPTLHLHPHRRSPLRLRWCRESAPELAEQAVLVERRRIARDVHDFVGHGLAGRNRRAGHMGGAERRQRSRRAAHARPHWRAPR